MSRGLGELGGRPAPADRRLASPGRRSIAGSRGRSQDGRHGRTLLQLLLASPGRRRGRDANGQPAHRRCCLSALLARGDSRGRSALPVSCEPSLRGFNCRLVASCSTAHLHRTELASISAVICTLWLAPASPASRYSKRSLSVTVTTCEKAIAISGPPVPIGVDLDQRVAAGDDDPHLVRPVERAAADEVERAQRREVDLVVPCDEVGDGVGRVRLAVGGLGEHEAVGAGRRRRGDRCPKPPNSTSLPAPPETLSAPSPP